ncbi:MAG: CamS family sex pheromone protein [Bacillales bacterium]|nr:CamS family sex pheromone protein [Bacillales bacterium]
MIMKKIVLIAMSCILLTGCASRFDSNKTDETTPNSTNKVVIPEYKISGDNYQSVLPFLPSKSRGLVVNNLNSRTDLEAFEEGLMDLSKEAFPTDKYYFREGQFLETATIKSWLARKYSAAQLAAKLLKEKDNLGLNPLDDEVGTIKERNEKAPEYLAHILEQNYLVKTDDKVKLGGISIGLALNSVYYYKEVVGGDNLTVTTEREKLVAEGKKLAQEVITRMRNDKDIPNVPITIALFEQQSIGSVLPGTFLTSTDLGKGDRTISNWKDIDKKNILFPSTEADKNYHGDQETFLNFKDIVEEYFPNFSGVIGQATYRNKVFEELKITIPIQFYGKTEVLSFTQFVAGEVMRIFPSSVQVDVEITSTNGSEALIVRTPGKDTPFIYIYN